MTKTITIHPSPFEFAFQRAKKGAVFYVNLHGCEWPAALRQNPPRVRLLEDGRWEPRPVLCELLDPWPGAPAYYPKQWAPDAKPEPHSFYGIHSAPGR